MKQYYYLKEAIKSKNKEKMEIAFEKFYTEKYKEVTIIIRGYVNNRCDAEELTNDVFLKFFNNMYNIDCDINAYLKTIIRNTIISYTRSKEFKSHYEYILSNEIIETTPDYESDDQYRAFFFDLKQELNPTAFFIIEERLLYKSTFLAISKKTKLSINTVKSIYSREIKKIQERIEKNDF